MSSDEQRAHMARRLADYLEGLQLHLQMIHRMYADHLLPETVYLQEVAATTAERDAIQAALDVVSRRKAT